MAADPRVVHDTVEGVPRTTIIAPPAQWPAPPPQVAAEYMREAEVAALRKQVADLQLTASTIANVAICASQLYRDANGTDLVIPAALVERMEGAQIQLRQLPNGAVQVRHTERAPYPVVKEA